MLTINNHYNFSVYANSILGSSYDGVKLVSILNYETAVKFGNVDMLHKQIYPYLPANTPSDQTKYTYYLFEHKGKLVVLASVWIIESSIVSSTGTTYTIRLNNIDNSKLTLITNQLRLLGVSFEII